MTLRSCFKGLQHLSMMLDPLTAVSLASSVVQFTDFGIKLIRGSIKLYETPDGVHADYADLETKIDHARKLAKRVMRPFDNTGELMRRRNADSKSYSYGAIHASHGQGLSLKA